MLNLLRKGKFLFKIFEIACARRLKSVTFMIKNPMAGEK